MAALGIAVRVSLVAAAAALGAVTGFPGGQPPLRGAAVGFLLGLLFLLAERAVARAAPGQVAGALGGLLAGLLAARWLPVEGAAARQLAALLLGWLGLVLGARHLAQLRFSRAPLVSGGRAAEPVAVDPLVKVVDTSVIIDGRIADVVESGFVEGRLVVPQFVIRELQQVADSSDPLKRARGRKGLDVLKTLQESERVEVQIVDRDFPEIEDVDGKLLALAEEVAGKVLTNDYNLNKVAQLRGVLVLNVNDLANAVKPVVLPGESLKVQVIKEGKERNQGVGYLDDGTMVVVDNARDCLGESIEVLVTSVIQTNAGKMIFASPDEERPEETLRVARREHRAVPPVAGEGPARGADRGGAD